MTNANSPPWERTAPATKASRQERPTSGPSAVTTPVLVAIKVVVMIKIIGNISMANGTSMVVPMVTKKSERNKPLNAFSSLMIWCAYFVSAKTIPARNAPNESLKPIAEQAKEKPKRVSKDMATKTSVPASAASTASKPTNASDLPANASAPRSSMDVAPPAAMTPISMLAPPPLAAAMDNTGNKIINGTTAKS